MKARIRNPFRALVWPLALTLGVAVAWVMPVDKIAPAVALHIGAEPSASAVETNIAVGIAGLALRITVVAGKDAQ